MITTSLITVASVVAGGAAGYFAARLLCRGNTCPLTANRWLLALVGAGVGLALAYSTGLAARRDAPAAGGVRPSPITSARQWDETLASARTPVVLDFHAEWCGACQALALVIDEVAEAWADRVAFYTVDVDDVAELAERFGVQGIPTLVYFADGREIRRTTGLMSKAELETHLRSLVNDDGQ